ncbi:hypothetical protein DXB23_01555 [Dorea sp. OM02-2LB]|nr:hypothetical protein DXB23_01555 [Dorea sp. OM02-2LB]
MGFYELEDGDEEFLEKCPVCDEGYMVPTLAEWYQCSNCGVEAKINEYGLLVYDSSVRFK